MDNEGEDKSYQAYQALGALILNPGMEVSDDEAKRALDYFSGLDEYDEDFLPWPKLEATSQPSVVSEGSTKPSEATQVFRLIEHTCSDDGKNRDEDPLKTHDFTIELDGKDFLIEPDEALPDVTFGQLRHVVTVLNKLKKADQNF